MMAYAVAPQPLYKPARPREDADYLKFLRTQPCAVWGCQAHYTEAAHIGGRGLSQKADDRQAIPLCRRHHQSGPNALHRLGPKRFQLLHRLNFRLIAEKLNQKYEEL